MFNTHEKIFFSIPEPTLRRLPWYLAYAKLTQKSGGKHLSSTQIAQNIAVNQSIVAKDLSFVNISGKTRVGYSTDELIQVLEGFLGFKKSHKAFLFGVGSLGGALLHDSGLQQFGLEIIAGFDIREDLIGTSINTIKVYHIDQYNSFNEQNDVKIGILAVPIEKAQSVCDTMIEGGIKAIWNFTPFRIRVPKNIVVQNTSIYAHLAVMFNRLGAINEIDTSVLNKK